MTDIVDLDVTNLCERVYALQRDVEAQPRADDVSRGDFVALTFAVRDLFDIARDKLHPEPLA